MPGFGPAAEALLFRQKAPKPLTPSLALLEGRTQDGERTNSLRSDKARQLIRASDPRAEQQASDIEESEG
jgi:hypothetical protein